MARPGRPERNRTARSFRQLRRFHHVTNSDKVFGTHTLPQYSIQSLPPAGPQDLTTFGDLPQRRFCTGRPERDNHFCRRDRWIGCSRCRNGCRGIWRAVQNRNSTRLDAERIQRSRKRLPGLLVLTLRPEAKRQSWGPLPFRKQSRTGHVLTSYDTLKRTTQPTGISSHTTT